MKERGEAEAQLPEELEQLRRRVAELEQAEAERERIEEKMEHLNAVLRAIRGVNQLITREGDRDRLLQGACERLIETRGYHHAWTALIDESGGLNAAAEAGLGKAFPSLIERLKRGELPHCAQRTLAQTGIVAIEDPSSACADCSLASTYGDRGAMATRLERRGEVYGLISVSIPKNLVADKEEHSLLKEVAGDLAFALHDIRLEEARRRAEETLRESEEKYRDLFENARDVIVAFDLKGNVTAVNKAITEYGFSKDNLVGKNMLKFVAKRYWPRLLKELAKVTRGNPIEGEIELTTPKGTRAAEYRSNPIRRGGKVVGFQTILRDITERKRLEGRLAAVRALGRRLVLSQDRAEIARAAVEAAREVLGLEDCGLFLVDEGTGRLVLAAHTLGSPPGPKEFPLDGERGIMVAVARSGEAIYLPDVTRDPRFWGGTRPTRSELCVPLKVGARVLGVLNAESEELGAFNLEDRQLLEALANAAAVALESARLSEETHKLKEFNESIVQNMTEGVVIEDAEGILTFVNPALVEMLGYAPEELLGKHWTDIVPPDQQPIIQAAYERRRRGETDRYEVELVGKDGERLSVLVSGSPRFEDWRFAGTQAVFTDITARVRAEEALKQSYERLGRLLEQTVDVLASAVEIRDPYTAGHQRRVTELACAIAQELGLPEEQIDGLRMAALVHDIGKIYVPAEILSKPGPLSPKEMELVKTHSQASYDVLKKIEFPWPVAQIVLQHHERLDGSGYPQGLKGDEIMLEARILGVADVVEA
ncbi:MAG: PAS domain S-box protein, partial [Candidatus Bipolaricaulia bacterium]